MHVDQHYTWIVRIDIPLAKYKTFGKVILMFDIHTIQQVTYMNKIKLKEKLK